jgi:hypothetical protein
METESQVQQGPFLLSFGNVHKQVNFAKKSYRLSDSESHFLQCFIQTMNRPGYKTHLNHVDFWDIEYWEEHTGLIKTHIYRTIRTLARKAVILSFGGKGKKQCHFLHPEFAEKLRSETVRFYRPVHNSTDSDQSGHTTQTNLVTDSDQSGHSDLYIEDSLPIPKESLTLPSSIPPVDNVDNFSESEKLLAKFFMEDELANAKAFMVKLKPNQLERFPDFLAFLENTPNWRMDVKGMNLMWVKWFYKELERT